ncbi:hypothetical protein NH26_01365 [Flammeovirga pacifica]|uniref:Uncharacterized protein n=1 Tax=Flammeovirga pacifica TaxID=915059 RepID=A0A1S1YW40_FLAPC|nr:hypothetical protein NH26_01365 [Flammeovirga pacifica]
MSPTRGFNPSYKKHNQNKKQSKGNVPNEGFQPLIQKPQPKQKNNQKATSTTRGFNPSYKGLHPSNKKRGAKPLFKNLRTH